MFRKCTWACHIPHTTIAKCSLKYLFCWYSDSRPSNRFMEQLACSIAVIDDITSSFTPSPCSVCKACCVVAQHPCSAEIGWWHQRSRHLMFSVSNGAHLPRPQNEVCCSPGYVICTSSPSRGGSCSTSTGVIWLFHVCWKKNQPSVVIIIIFIFVVSVVVLDIMHRSLTSSIRCSVSGSISSSPRATVAIVGLCWQ